MSERSGLARTVAAAVVFVVSLETTPQVTSTNVDRRSSPASAVELASQERIQPLTVDDTIAKDIRTGETHRYAVSLEPGQYVSVVIDQRGTDLAATVVGPNGSSRLEIDGRWDGPEQVPIVAEQPGAYEVHVRTIESFQRPRPYTIVAHALRPATDRDADVVAAWRASTDAKRLVAQGTAASLKGAVTKYEGILPVLRSIGDSAFDAQTLNSLGFVLNALSDQKQALERYRRALELWRIVGDARGEAETTHNIGAVYSVLGDRQQALKTYQSALELRRKAGDRRGESTTLTNLGSIAYALGDNRVALDYADQAIPGFRAFEDRRGEAFAQNVIGSAFTALGNYQEALERYARVLTLMESLDERGVAAGHTNMGTLHYSLGDNPTALDHLNRALALFRKAGDRRSEARVLINIGRGYAGDEALARYAEALPLARAVGDRNAEALALNNMASIHYALGDTRQALEVGEQALRLMSETGDRRGEGGALNNLGSAYVLLGQPAGALERFNRALQLMRSAEDKSGEAATLFNIARAQRLTGDLENARRRIEEATDIVESLRSRVVSQDLRAFFYAAKRDYYELFVDVLMALHERDPTDRFDRTALQVSERARARSLLETLVEARANIREGVDERLVREEQRLQEQINAKADSLRRLLAGPHLSNEESAIRLELDSALARYRDLQATIRLASPRYAALTQPEPLGIPQIQELLAEGTLLLEYSLGAERSYVWAVTRTTFSSFALAPRATIEAAARQVHQSWQRRGQDPTAGRNAEQAAAALSRLILTPIGGLADHQRLLVVADGALQYVSFAALPSPVPDEPRGKRPIRPQSPLILDHEIVSLPAASVLGALRRSRSGRVAAEKTVAILADPVFEMDDSRIDAISRRTVTGSPPRETRVTGPERELSRSVVDTGTASAAAYIPRLPFSRREADGIASLAPQSSLKAVGFSASRATATSAELARYRIVHFATHALINTIHPELSGVVLSLVSEQGQLQDGFLRLHDIYNLRLPTDLVVLSACQTALGQEVRGEGLVGLTRGFMYAGASRVAVTLWKVDDEATSELMKLFYTNMLGRSRLRPAAALRAAQIALMQHTRWNAPYYWAGFVLQGEYE